MGAARSPWAYVAARVRVWRCFHCTLSHKVTLTWIRYGWIIRVWSFAGIGPDPPPFRELFCANGWNCAPSLAPFPRSKALRPSGDPRRHVLSQQTRGQLARAIRGESQYASQPPQLKPEQKNPTKGAICGFASCHRPQLDRDRPQHRPLAPQYRHRHTDDHGGIPAQEEIG